MSEKISKTTEDFFISRVGDSINVELIVTKNVDGVISKIIKSLTKGTELFNGVKVKQLYFKGKDPNGMVRDAKRKVLQSVMEELNNMDKELGEGEVNSLTDF